MNLRVLFAVGLFAFAPFAFGTPLVRASVDPVIAAAGDISCMPTDSGFNGGAGTATRCHQRATSDILVAMTDLSAVLGLGDQQYNNGELENFLAVYDPTWGRVKSITRPSAGNHEYGTPGAADYYTYFGAAAGDPARGYYSFDVGAWHLIALNSNCAAGPEIGCAVGSPQHTWLLADLAANDAPCTLAYWHHPRFTYGGHSNFADVGPFWDALYAHGADVVLNGHDHVYERFRPLSPLGLPDDDFGIRQFVVGTGGKSHYSWSGAASAVVQSTLQVEFRNNTEFGVIRMTLHDASYDWEWITDTGVVLDSGTDACH